MAGSLYYFKMQMAPGPMVDGSRFFDNVLRVEGLESSRQNELPRTALTHFAMLVLRPSFSRSALPITCCAWRG